ncbi:MAG: S-layer homology domain-containing protein [Clostridia bacterium]|nr:S-layer homology domain-containing protein [Clostridia bacterium]
MNYRLENKEEGIVLTRNISYSTEEEEKGDQIIWVTRVNSFSENIRAGKDNYRLDDFQFSKSIITDKKPAVDYFSGSWTGRKTYKVNNTAGEIVVSFQGETVGYDNSWGNTETQRIWGNISFDGDVTFEEEVHHDKWSGTFHADVTYNKIKHIRYQENEPQQISFPGGHVLVEEEDHSLKFMSELPLRDGRGLARGGWDTRRFNLNMKSAPTYERLPVHFLRDMSNHWAKGDVELLYGLGIFSGGEYFGPGAPMTRGEFSRSLARALKLEIIEEKKDNNRRPQQRPRPNIQLPWGPIGGQQPEEEDKADAPMFIDVPDDHPYYGDIKAVNDKDLIRGTGPGYFSPESPLTRAQAVATFIRALGFEHLAPPMYSRTGFADDGRIPDWARGAVHVASDIGLVGGDRYGYFHPNQEMTRAEGASLINRFVQYMQDDLRKEYRDKIMGLR